MTQHDQPPRKVPFGRLLITPRAQDLLPAAAVQAALTRHARGDWGDCCEDDRLANEKAIARGGRLYSVYSADGVTFWVITEADRSATTVLLPEDY